MDIVIKPNKKEKNGLLLRVRTEKKYLENPNENIINKNNGIDNPKQNKNIHLGRIIINFDQDPDLGNTYRLKMLKGQEESNYDLSVSFANISQTLKNLNSNFKENCMEIKAEESNKCFDINDNNNLRKETNIKKKELMDNVKKNKINPYLHDPGNVSKISKTLNFHKNHNSSSIIKRNFSRFANSNLERDKHKQGINLF
jgi:hypothetical protein